MNLYSFMLINKDASRIYPITLSSKQLLYVCMCLCVIIYTLHTVTVEEKSESIDSFPIRGGQRKLKSRFARLDFDQNLRVA